MTTKINSPELKASELLLVSSVNFDAGCMKVLELESLLKDIFNDITKDNKVSPDTFDRLVEALK